MITNRIFFGWQYRAINLWVFSKVSNGVHCPVAVQMQGICGSTQTGNQNKEQ